MSNPEMVKDLGNRLVEAAQDARTYMEKAEAEFAAHNKRTSEAMNYADARIAIRKGCLALLERNTAGVGSLVLAEYEAARCEYRALHHEDGPGWEIEPDKCSDMPCIGSGTWGATGNMPNGHFWYWQNADHTGGYLAHSGTGRKGS